MRRNADSETSNGYGYDERLSGVCLHDGAGQNKRVFAGSAQRVVTRAYEPFGAASLEYGAMFLFSQSVFVQMLFGLLNLLYFVKLVISWLSANISFTLSPGT